MYIMEIWKYNSTTYGAYGDEKIRQRNNEERIMRALETKMKNVPMKRI